CGGAIRVKPDAYAQILFPPSLDPYSGDQSVGYSHNMNCSWIVYSSNIEQIIVLSFLHFHLEESFTCRFDYMEVFDGYSRRIGK
ncbi:unnamed protein product, partial [Protopolystoma xenopodis]